MNPLRFTGFWLLCGAGFVALVIFLSLTPEDVDAGRIGEVKVGHFIAYCWLMLWFAQIYKALGARIAIAVALALLGAALEYAQGLTGYRSFAYSDMRDNAIGVVAGLALGLTAAGRVLARFEGSAWPRRMRE